MNISDFSFHDSQILEVKETSQQTIDFFMNCCIDWENSIYEKRILRFHGVISYLVDEIPFSGTPAILETFNLGRVTKLFGTGRNQIEAVRNKIEIQTNAGRRIIEYSECDLITP